MKNALISLGLTEKEIEVYLAILELGQANVLDIAQKSRVPRATVYGILEKLSREDLIGSIIQGKRRFYLAEDPKKIAQKMKEREQKIARFLPKLEGIYLQATHRPVIRVYEGAAGIIKMLDDIFQTIPRGGTFDVILNASDEFQILGEAYFNHIKERAKRKIKIRAIAEPSEFTKNWPKEVKKYLRQYKFLPKGQKFLVSYHIYGNKVSMFSLQWPVVGVIIENKEIADMEKMQFEYMWKALK